VGAGEGDPIAVGPEGDDGGVGVVWVGEAAPGRRGCGEAATCVGMLRREAMEVKRRERRGRHERARHNRALPVAAAALQSSVSRFNDNRTG
jgi:hypothetical protein